MFKKRKDLAISSQAKHIRFIYSEGSETIIGTAREGRWYSPFLLETRGVKEAPDVRAIRAPTT